MRWPNGLASQRKFAKPELAHGLVKGGQTDSQVGPQVTKSRKFHAYHWLMRFYNNRLLAINLCRLALGGQMVKNLCLLVSNLNSTKVNASRHKSMQVDASRWPNETQVELKSKTCADLRVRLARASHCLVHYLKIKSNWYRGDQTFSLLVQVDEWLYIVLLSWF